MIQAAVEVVPQLAALAAVFGLCALGARWQHRRNERVLMVREEGPDRIGRAWVARRMSRDYEYWDGWERAEDRPDLVATLERWEAAR